MCLWLILQARFLICVGKATELIRSTTICLVLFEVEGKGLMGSLEFTRSHGLRHKTVVVEQLIF